MVKEKSFLDKMSKTEKGLLITGILSVFSWMGMFAYQNFSFPKDDKRIDLIQEYIDNDKSEKAVMKNDMGTMKESIKEIKSDMKEGFKALGDKMDENNRIVKVVRENTK